MTKNKRRKGDSPVLPELLAPAGNLEKLITAIHYGADAVYLGGKQLSLRAGAGNFNKEDMIKGVDFAHAHGRKVYITINVLAHNSDLEGLEKYLHFLRKIEVDGIIVADPGILQIAAQTIGEMPIHLSTQANVTNHAAAQFWFARGVNRINLARELSLEEIIAIRGKTEKELEVFVHGALCISYSGRCMLSNYLTARDANQGNCSHPCRYSYQLLEEKRPGQFFPVEEDERGTYIFNAKDLCLLPLLPELVAAGVDSLKIEGRMKSIFYVGGVVRVYRAALDYLRELPPSAWENPAQIALPRQLVEEIGKTGTRGMSLNFLRHKPTKEDMLYESSRAQQIIEPVAVVLATGDRVLVEVRNRLQPGEELEYMGRGMETQTVIVENIAALKGGIVEQANPGNVVHLETIPQLRKCEIHSIFRREKQGAS